MYETLQTLSLLHYDGFILTSSITYDTKINIGNTRTSVSEPTHQYI